MHHAFLFDGAGLLLKFELSSGSCQSQSSIKNPAVYLLAKHAGLVVPVSCFTNSRSNRTSKCNRLIATAQTRRQHQNIPDAVASCKQVCEKGCLSLSVAFLITCIAGICWLCPGFCRIPLVHHTAKHCCTIKAIMQSRPTASLMHSGSVGRRSWQWLCKAE